MPNGTREQAFRAYYASMTDAELLAVAANRNSFVELARQIVGEEVARRGLEMPAKVLAQTAPAADTPGGGIRSLFHIRFRLRRFRLFR